MTKTALTWSFLTVPVISSIVLDLKNSYYYIKVSDIPSGNKLIKTMISSHVKISIISLISSLWAPGLSLKLYLRWLKTISSA